MNKVLKDIISIVESTTAFYFNEDGDSFLEFTSRENGDVGSEEPSQLDVDEARTVIKLIKSKYPDLGLKYDIETVDEWVYLTVFTTPISFEEFFKNK